MEERYIFGVDEDLFIFYADTCFDFKFAHIQKAFYKKNHFKYKNIRNDNNRKILNT